ncbi:phosphate ABC transporter, periplasmic phosphate-binding protein [Gloeothece citriformis PCC 7424]|uniref:Phosphate-binding protein n=1 Tax=Gloeothece citriformis (strain PCC 7424) TaxID=65393 RepID=B7KDI4_GLOC7|nr:phosphate ABC transporter substrate-binding protein PstS [Gloeothece citriformis]ACK69004.1 phosphate ABC transporter, periplasmic phosphate-binding protein [Gloeothece citriformis PCC 7424]
MINSRQSLISFLSVLTLIIGVTSCNGNKQTESTTGIVLPFTNSIRATGAGASFPAPLYQNWFVQLNRELPQLQFNFQSVGSGAGIEQFTSGTIDFGASDIGMTDEQIDRITRGVLLLPMTAGSIVLTYNLPGVDKLNLSREVYADIFLGNITNWNDPKIAQDNPDVTLPDQRITVVHRSDGSGTTAVFTNHLSAISPQWEQTIGSGTAVEWPATKGTFVGGRGNEGVTALVSQTPGSLGYVEYGFARKNNLPVAALQNQAGNFIVPSDESGTNTLSQVELPENLRAFITDPPGEESYPIVTYTWMLLFKKYDDPNKAIAMEAMVQFALNEGQLQSADLGYIKLPDNVRERVAAAADEITPDFKITLRNLNENQEATAK